MYRRTRASQPQSQGRELAVTLRRRVDEDAEDMLDSFRQLGLRDNESTIVNVQRNCRCTRGCRLCEEPRYRTTYDDVESPVYFRVTSKESRDYWAYQGVTTEKRVTIRRKTIRY